MILGIGTDIVEIRRMIRWQHRSPDVLKKIFSDQELIDCRAPAGGYLSEKLATRFAAKEACFKALSQALIRQQNPASLNFFTICRNLSVGYYQNSQIPYLLINWTNLAALTHLASSNVHLSLAHEHHHALAFVIIGKNDP